MNLKLSLIILIICIFLYQFTYSKFLDVNAKKNVRISYLRVCEKDNDNTYKFNLSFKKHNRTHVGLGMNITVLDYVDHTFELEFELRVWKDGGWKKNFVYLKRKNACSTLYMLGGPIWTSIIDAAHCNRGCPVKPGFYYFDDMHFDLSQSQLILQPGRLFLFARVLKNNTVPACLEAEAEITAE